MAKRARTTDFRIGRDMKASLLLFFGVLVVYMLTANTDPGQAGVTDWIFTAFPAWTLAHQGTLDIDQIRVATTQGWQIPVGDAWRSDRLPGAIMVAVPFYWLLGSEDVFEMAPGALAAAASAAVAVFFLHRALLGLVSARLAMAGALVAAFCTPMWSVAGDTLWTHGPALMGLTGGLWAMSRSSYVPAGLGFAFAVFSRPTTAVVAATMGLWESVTQRSVVPALKVGAASLLGIVGLLIYNRLNINEWTLLPGSYTGRGGDIVTTAPGGQDVLSRWAGRITGSLVSPLRGVVVYTPFLLLLLPGLRRAWRVAPTWVRSAAVGGVVMLVLQLGENSWIGGDGYFGYRVTLETVIMAAPLLVLCWQEWTVRQRWSRYAFLGLVAVTMWTFAVASVVKSGPLASGGSRSFRDAMNWLLPEVLEATDPVVWILAAVFVALVGWLVMRPSPLLAGGPPSTDRPRRPEQARKPEPAKQAKSPSAAGRAPAKNKKKRR